MHTAQFNASNPRWRPSRCRQRLPRQAAKLRPAFTAPALRDIRFKAADRLNSRGEIIKGNGSVGAWVTIGRKVLLDLDAFDKWIASHKAGGAA